jgi:hypothetical protein
LPASGKTIFLNCIFVYEIVCPVWHTGIMMTRMDHIYFLRPLVYHSLKVYFMRA